MLRARRGPALALVLALLVARPRARRHRSSARTKPALRSRPGRGRAADRAEGGRAAQGHEREARGGALDGVHRGHDVREPQRLRRAAGLHDDLGGDPPAARQARASSRPATDRPTEFYYDGKTMTQFSPAENLVAIANAPPTIDAMLKSLYDVAGTYFAFTDVIVADPWADIAPGLKLAFYIGQSGVVGGVEDRHGGLRGRGRLRADLDRRRRQAAAPGARGLLRRPAAAAPPGRAVALAARHARSRRRRSGRRRPRAPSTSSSPIRRRSRRSRRLPRPRSAKTAPEADAQTLARRQLHEDAEARNRRRGDS